MELPKCQIGSMVKVLNVPYKWANVDRSAQSKDGNEKDKFLERFALSGVVREYVSHPNGISVKVRLKYTNEDVDVGEAQCILAEDYEVCTHTQGCRGRVHRYDDHDRMYCRDRVWNYLT